MFLVCPQLSGCLAVRALFVLNLRALQVGAATALLLNKKAKEPVHTGAHDLLLLFFLTGWGCDLRTSKEKETI